MIGPRYHDVTILSQSMHPLPALETRGKEAQVALDEIIFFILRIMLHWVPNLSSREIEKLLMTWTVKGA